MRMWPVALAMLALVLSRGEASATDSAMALGRHLSQECTACHRLDGTDNGIPSIIGLEADYFVETLNFYKSGQRHNAAMMSVAQSLDDEQIKALSLYFASLPRPEPPAAAAGGAPPRKGQRR